MKYPLDNQGIIDITQDIVMHHRAQCALIADLVELLRTAMECVAEEDADDNPWLSNANELLSSLKHRQVEFENHRFNQTNGHSMQLRSPFPAEAHEMIPSIDIKKEAELNAFEAQEFGGEMSAEEVARMLETEVKPKKTKKKKQQKLNKMSLAEIEDWEAAQDNSNDIYKVSARIKNLARAGVKANLTPQGDMVTNTFTHMIKAFYDFAETVPDKETKARLIQLARKQEEVPAGLIAALSAGVRAPT